MFRVAASLFNLENTLPGISLKPFQEGLLTVLEFLFKDLLFFAVLQEGHTELFVVAFSKVSFLL
jgi:hypothetical protein